MREQPQLNLIRSEIDQNIALFSDKRRTDTPAVFGADWNVLQIGIRMRTGVRWTPLAW